MESLKEILNNRKFTSNYFEELENESDFLECEICNSARWIIVNKETVPCSCQKGKSDDLETQEVKKFTRQELKELLLQGEIGEVQWTATAALGLMYITN